jgi:phospholipid/cholesterol/gamma-HCH transport system substrate-binding protein
MSLRPGESAARRRLAGVAFLVVLALLAWLSVALYQKTFSSAAMVTLYTSNVGNEMHPGAQVKVRGVQVGEVRQVSANGSGARLLLALQPGALPRLPANVSAMMLPTTLFGERYVELIVPARPSARTLAAGSVIRQNRSADALELDRVLNNLLPMLTAVQPDKLSLTLTAIAQGLSGRGENLGHTLVTLNAYLRNMTPLLPALDEDIKLLAGLTRTYTEAAPAILAALNDFAVTGRTIATQRADFASLLANLTTTSDDLRAFLEANSGNVIRLAADSLPTLRILATYAPEFPCTLRRLAQFVPKINKVLGAGTREPGLHVHVVVVPSPGKYVPSRDTPVYGDNLGPHCYPVPFRGIHLNDGVGPRTGTKTASSGGSAPAHPAATTASLSAFGPGGVAGSPAEAELVRELAGLSLGRRPSALPAWGTVLVAPLFRGAGVVIR